MARANLEILARVAAFWAFISADCHDLSVASGQPNNLPCRTVRNKLQMKGYSMKKGKPQVLQRSGGFHYGHELVGVVPKQLVEKIQ